MKNLYLILRFTLILAVSNLYSQNDTLYVMKAGVIIKKQSIKHVDVDSIVFYKPTVYIEQTLYGDSLSEEDNLFLESISIPAPEQNEMLDADGNAIGAGKSTSTDTNFLTEMLKYARLLCSEKTTKKHESDGINKPEHYGFAYSYGQRNITERLPPPAIDANDIHKAQWVYGTDCSGFLINLLRSQGINITKDANVSNFEGSLRTAIQNNPSLKNVVKVENKGALTISEMKSGDIIKWAGHIGILTTLNNGLTEVFQSNGTNKPVDDADQTKNLGLNRGVHTFSLNKCLNITSSDYWGRNYQIIRMSNEPYMKTLTDGSSKTWRVTVFTNQNGDALLGSVLKYTFKSDYTYTKTLNGNSAAGGTFGFDLENNKFYLNATTNLYDFDLTAFGFTIDKANPLTHMEMIPQ